MAKLLLNGANGHAQELPLKSGANRVGRNESNDIQIEHPSVSSFHCEINCAGDAIRIKDLGSTNGTFIESSPIQEGALAHGQRLQLGSVEMIFDSSAAQAAAVAVPASAAKPRLSVSLPPHSTPAPAASAQAAPALASAPSAPAPPKPAYQANRNEAEQQARSKMLWGDPPEDVTKYLMMQGLGAEEASNLTALLLQERIRMLRGIGTRKILVGVGLMCVPPASYVVMASIGMVFIKILGAACAVGLWGAWMCLKGAFMVLAPKSEPGDVADK